MIYLFIYLCMVPIRNGTARIKGPRCAAVKY